MGDPGELPQPAAYLRRNLALSKNVQSARLYVTALGSYRVFLNGKRVGQDVLTPDFTDYRKRVLYQVYDVTKLLVSGKQCNRRPSGRRLVRQRSDVGRNAFLFSSGPFCGTTRTRLRRRQSRHRCDRPIMEGRRHPPFFDRIFTAEKSYDARLEQTGWENADFDDSKWKSALVGDPPAIAVSSQITAPAAR